MQTEYIMFLLVFPIFSEGCCVKNHQRKNADLQQDIPHEQYRAVEGEIFMMPCLKRKNLPKEVKWSRTGEGREGNVHPSFGCGKTFLAEAKHSGRYTCLRCGSKVSFRLQVVEKNSLRCFNPEESSKYLQVNAGGEVPCPGLNCNDNTDVIWYKGIKAVSEQRRASCELNGSLRLCQVSESDTGVYFCDRQINEQGVKWTFRRAVNVTVIPFSKPSCRPRIMRPDGNRTEEVELGQSHILLCEIYYPFEILFSPKVQWYMNYKGNMENKTLLQMRSDPILLPQEFKVTQKAIIKKVTPQHLDSTYTCIATNIVGNSSVTVKLRTKVKVKWPSLIEYPIAPLLLVAGLGIVLHVKWVELQLIFRSYFQLGKHNKDKKEFDVFLSYVWSPTSDVEEILMSSFQTRPDTDEEASSSRDLLNPEECEATQRPLEVWLPQVLEDQWGYRLCLLERDVLPGGAYANDVVLAIQKSQMLICLLSADYLSNSNAVFVLESGVQALLHNSTLKVLLIWTDRASASQIKPDPVLPTLVQRALKVLPSLNWTSGKPAKGSNNFWRCLQKAMPSHRVKMVSLKQKR